LQAQTLPAPAVLCHSSVQFRGFPEIIEKISLPQAES
jgi:hypothetical protein